MECNGKQCKHRVQCDAVRCSAVWSTALCMECNAIVWGSMSEHTHVYQYSNTARKRQGHTCSRTQRTNTVQCYLLTTRCNTDRVLCPWPSLTGWLTRIQTPMLTRYRGRPLLLWTALLPRHALASSKLFRYSNWCRPHDSVSLTPIILH